MKWLVELKTSVLMFFKGTVLVAKVETWLIPITVVSSVVNAVYPFIGIYYSAKLLNELISEERRIDKLLMYAGLIVGLNLLCKVVSQLLNQLADVLQYTLMHKKELFIADKCCRLDYADMEDNELWVERSRLFRYRFEKGIMSIQYQIKTLLEALLTIIISISLTSELFRLQTQSKDSTGRILDSTWLAVILVVYYFITLSITIRSARVVQKKRIQVEDETGHDYGLAYHFVDDICSNYHNGKDVRIFNQKHIIDKDLYKHFTSIIKKESVIPKLEQKRGILTKTMNQALNIMIYVYTGLKALYGAFGAGNILKYSGSIQQFSRAVTELAQCINSMVENKEYLNTYFTFLDRPNCMKGGNIRIDESIRKDYIFEFKNISFCYPGSDAYSLKNISCVLSSKEKTAIVGRNGSGKTTFIKLLCRLYDPQEGEILLNGINIKEYDYDDYLRFFSVVFQDFKIFSFTLGENVAAASDYDLEKAGEALIEAGFEHRLKELKDGVETQLYNDYSEEGVEISGGEAQKIAIARALYKNAPFVILDEPTAALDPLAEADIYTRLNNFIQDKGAVYISHRLSSCYFCDKIFVFKDGGLKEQGTQYYMEGAS
jgi:ATP-binding cassette subfamily B protein